MTVPDPANTPDVDRTVDDAGLDSFPASDPPGWWAGTEPAPTPDQNEEDTRWA